MGEKIRQIAVVLGAINLDNQKRLLLGMENAAKEMNANLYVFTNYVGTRETEESVMASSQILKLLEFDKFDGLILVPNTIHNPIALKKILEDVQKVEREQVAQVTGTNKDDSLAKAPKKRAEAKAYPNDPCPCGSGKKYKQCCGRK